MLKILKQIKQLAKAGDENALFDLALIYFNGKEIPKDNKEAFKWWIRSSEQKITKARYEPERVYSSKELFWIKEAAEEWHYDALLTLALMYYNGEGFQQDYEEAFGLIEYLAEDRGGLEAQFVLGVMYYNGHGISRDYEKAFKWYVKAAEQDCAEAQFILSIMLYMGQGIRRDYEEAAKWLTKAAEQELAQAQIILRIMYEHDQIIDRVDNGDFAIDDDDIPF
jgi:hypothetical protein